MTDKNKIDEPNWIVLYLMDGHVGWDIYWAGLDEDEAKKQLEIAIEDSGIIGEFRLIESEYICADSNNNNPEYAIQFKGETLTVVRKGLPDEYFKMMGMDKPNASS